MKRVQEKEKKQLSNYYPLGNAKRKGGSGEKNSTKEKVEKHEYALTTPLVSFLHR